MKDISFNKYGDPFFSHSRESGLNDLYLKKIIIIFLNDDGNVKDIGKESVWIERPTWGICCEFKKTVGEWRVARA